MTEYVNKIPRVWRYFLRYLGKGLLFMSLFLISMLVFHLVLGYFNVPEDLRTPLWFAVYFTGLAVWFMWDEAKKKVELENIKILNTIEKGK